MTNKELTKLTQQRRFPGEVQHSPFGHNQLHSEGQCSYSCPKHPLSLQPQGELEHIQPYGESFRADVSFTRPTKYYRCLSRNIQQLDILYHELVYYYISQDETSI